ncbi:uncharacterized protein PADG_01103 [Paracoccidioides brasiliensis Pb18]|uniref:Uncharacterized protein n=1 Tax=Paracoccidioides brasiliensis (strain Pb18) TaxID=502780 RepID=C1FZ77_PARBD|nr:uncharacterized protein PADG_01103 [Paracoccidioides brasiliensis Pb18]EEH44814.2 hypothetical protein PADG_01103 [Paracoccidioides brasiliensis Pb18]
MCQGKPKRTIRVAQAIPTVKDYWRVKKLFCYLKGLFKMQVDQTDGAPKRRVRDTRVLEWRRTTTSIFAPHGVPERTDCRSREDPATAFVSVTQPSLDAENIGHDPHILMLLSAMGAIPSIDNMVSSIVLSPAPDDIVKVNKPIEFRIRVTNLATGYFTNPAETYFAAPQLVNEKGLIEGHLHVTVQFLGDKINPQTPLNASNPIWFKGIRNKADGDGILSATLDKGLEKPGFYRVCTMAAAANHQPVLMPIAARGAQDDCTKFRVKW